GRLNDRTSRLANSSLSSTSKRVGVRHVARKVMTMMRTELALTATRTWIGFGLMCLGMLMAILDIQVVATSLPTIQNALAISHEAMSWIQTAYLIAEIIAIPLTGWLTNMLSMRWLFTAAIAFFTLASIGGAASGEFAMLVSFRVVQGFAGGTLIPTCLPQYSSCSSRARRALQQRLLES